MSHSHEVHEAVKTWADEPVVADAQSHKDSQNQLFALLSEKFGATLDPLDSWGLTVVTEKARLHELMQFLRDDEACLFNMMLDITAVDYLNWPGHEGPRFSVVYILRSLSIIANRIRVKVWVDEEDLDVPTVSDLWKIADWQERETFDQYGIQFVGHHNLKRLLNHHEFVGHPLRKDYPAQRRQKLSMNDPMLDQMEARLKAQGYTILDGIPETSPQVEDVLKGGN
jgi:NADH-quinone oxidoreductase subunit C